MKGKLTLKEIQIWEKDFCKKKKLDLDKNSQIKVATLKLTEEVGEVMKAILEDKWNEVPAEISDVIVFACKISNIAEEFFGADSLEDVFLRKMKYSEKRKFKKGFKKLNKPKDKEFK